MIQAYVADSTDPKDRARALGWLSATTNLGVALGPVLGSFAITLGKYDLMPGPATVQMGRAGPGIMAAGLCVLNMIFAARYLTESRDLNEKPREGYIRPTSRTGDLAGDLAGESAFISSYLDLCDLHRSFPGEFFGACALPERALSSHRTDDRVFFHVHRVDFGLRERAAFGACGRLARRSASVASGACAAGRQALSGCRYRGISRCWR